MIYQISNITFHLFHQIVIVASVFGFLWTDQLALYLALQVMILGSWVGYGLYDNRWGRCVVTDIQWYFKGKYGVRPATESYVQYWIEYKWGFDKDEKIVDAWVTGIYAVTFLTGLIRYFTGI
jgi:hypothetical protein